MNTQNTYTQCLNDCSSFCYSFVVAKKLMFRWCRAKTIIKCFKCIDACFYFRTLLIFLFCCCPYLGSMILVSNEGANIHSNSHRQYEAIIQLQQQPTVWLSLCIQECFISHSFCLYAIVYCSIKEIEKVSTCRHFVLHLKNKKSAHCTVYNQLYQIMNLISITTTTKFYAPQKCTKIKFMFERLVISGTIRY